VRGKRNLLGAPRAPLAVSGAGLVSAAGVGLEALRAALDRGSSGLRPLHPAGGSPPGPWGEEPLDPAGIGGQVRDELLAGWEGLRAGDDRAVPLAAMAIEEAVRGPGAPVPRTGLSMGTALGPSGALEGLLGREGAEEADVLGDASVGFDAYLARLAECLEHALGARLAPPEPLSIFSMTCVSGLCALEQAAADIALGRADRMVVGGVDTLTAFMYGGFRSLSALSKSGRLRPFDASHDGILIGEAAAFIAVEPLRDARSRGAPFAGVIAGQRLVSDGIHMTSPDVEGKAMARAIRGALEDAGLAAGDIGCITVTAAGSAVYDRMQSAAVERALGPEAAAAIPVTTWESATGHALAATGILGIVHAVMVLRSGRMTALPEPDEPDPACVLRPVTGAPRELRSPCVLALTVGFGGQNGASIVTSPELAADIAGARGGPP